MGNGRVNPPCPLRRKRVTAKKFSELRQAMTPRARAQAEQQTQRMLAEMPLHELRRARGLSQKVLAETLHVQQPSVAKMERRTDIYISALRSHFEAVVEGCTSVLTVKLTVWTMLDDQNASSE
jgi:DNA-binding transcriptional regulator YiaG